MRPSIFAGAFALAASQVTAQTYNQSAPFNLVLTSQNSTFNGSFLSACHEGAGIEGLCLSGGSFGSPSQFTFNTTEASPTTGVLAYELQGGNFNESEAMQLSINPASNVAIPIFIPGQNPTYVGFDDNDDMFITSYQDDTKPLPNDDTTPLYRWWVCRTYYGYPYQTLSWVLGDKAPENPTCVAAQPVRVFI